MQHGGAGRRLSAVAIAVAGLTIMGPTSPLAQEARHDPSLEALIAAYPNELTNYDVTTLYWRDGTAMPLSDDDRPKSFEKRLRNPSIKDQLLLEYPRDALKEPPAPDADPGRFRNIAFFEKMYGNCKKDEVSPHLVQIVWLPKTWGKTIQITSINGVDRRLSAISDEIDSLPANIKRAAYPTAGTYNCRAVADTGLPSPHSYGIAIDLNLQFSDYWHWRPHAKTVQYVNRMPTEIVNIFERHGFIWGGKWYHFDTMHFEYRPELLAPEK